MRTPVLCLTEARRDYLDRAAQGGVRTGGGGGHERCATRHCTCCGVVLL